eukprot:304569-Rhodomonas_salina.2
MSPGQSPSTRSVAGRRRGDGVGNCQCDHGDGIGRRIEDGGQDQVTPVATTRSNPQNPYLHARAPPQPLMQQRVTGDVVPETQGSTATASGKEGRGVASVGTYHHVDASEQSKKAPSLSRI